MSTRTQEQSTVDSDSTQQDTPSTQSDNTASKGQVFSLADNEQAPIALDINRKMDEVEATIKNVTAQFAQSYDQLDRSLGQLDRHQNGLQEELANLSTQVKENQQQHEKSDQLLNDRLHDYADQFSSELKRADGLLADQKSQLESLQEKHDTLHQWNEKLQDESEAHDARTEKLAKSLTEKFEVAQTQYETLNDLHQEQRSDFESLAQSHRSLHSQVDDMGREFGKALKNHGLKHKSLATKVDSQAQQIDNILSNVALLHQQTRRGWHWTAGGLATLAVLLVGSFGYIQFYQMPGTAQLSDTVAELGTTVDNLGTTLANEAAALRDDMAGLNQRLTGTENTQQEITTDLGELQGQISGQQETLAAVDEQIAALELSVNGPEIQAPTPALTLEDGQWISQQPGGHYTIQLLGSYQEGYLPIFVNQHTEALQGETLSVNTGVNRGRDWHNLYYGNFASFDSALNALQALPPELQQNGPWIRSFSAVQSTTP